MGPSTYELWFNYALRTGYFRGLLTEALEKAGAQGLSVTLLAVSLYRQRRAAGASTSGDEVGRVTGRAAGG